MQHAFQYFNFVHQILVSKTYLLNKYTEQAYLAH